MEAYMDFPKRYRKMAEQQSNTMSVFPPEARLTNMVAITISVLTHPCSAILCSVIVC
jgi:hypothetical protein